jgi:hypothetical protein
MPWQCRRAEAVGSPPPMLHLDSHSLDFTPDVFKVWHFSL